MKSKIELQNIAVSLYGAAVVLFLAFFLYMGISENISVYKNRESHTYTEIVDFTTEKLEDTTAPAGVRSVYKWILTNSDACEKCLCFYVVHQEVEVYCGDELIYRLTADEHNRIGKTISSNWVTIPLYQEDAGKEITVILTPLFESMIDYDVKFLFGSHLSIIFDQLTQDLPQLFLASLCIFLGLFIMGAQFYLNLRTNNKTWDLFFLGNFSLLLGLYRITDMVSSPLLFSGNPMVLGYISIGTLFLCSIPLLLFMNASLTKKQAVPLLTLSAIFSVSVLIVLILQVLGIAEFKELLTLSHLMLIVSICAVPIIIFLNRQKADTERYRSQKYFLILAVGIIIDLILFYTKNSSSNVLFTTIAFILYAIIMFINRIVTMTQKAYTDNRTGLSNKIYWNELMTDHVPVTDSIGIIMMDLNGLKQVNDTFGHEAGDRMIFDFSNILRNVLPSSSVICRWGGDEFTILITDATRKKLETYVDRLYHAVDNYNASRSHAPLSFAVGFALSTEHPGLSRKDLLSIADTQMYQNKQKWHIENP